MAGKGRGSDIDIKAAAKRREEAEEDDGEDEDEDSDETDDEDGEDEVRDEMVCYLEDRPSAKERRLLTRRMFPSKVYASREAEKASAFHRVLHLFVCTSCNPNRARIFRAQLPRENPYYSRDPPDAEAIAKALAKAGDRDSELARLCCDSCGLPRAVAGDAPEGDGCAECARLQRIGETPGVFQERELRTEDAELLEEEEDDEAGVGTGKGKPPQAKRAGEDDVEEVFTPGARRAVGGDRDLVAEADAAIASAKARGASAEVLNKLLAYRDKVAEGAENAFDISEQAAFDQLAKENGDYDPVFSRFNRYAQANASHVLRYVYGGEPLWFSGPNQLAGKPPACERCGSKRIFEFQVQPQLIALLSGSRLADRLDYGTICCYVCSKSCDAAGEAAPYMEEFAHVQPEPCDAFLPRG